MTTSETETADGNGHGTDHDRYGAAYAATFITNTLKNTFTLFKNKLNCIKENKTPGLLINRHDGKQ